MINLPPELLYILLFAGSAFAGYMITWPLRRSAAGPPRGAKVRVRLPGGMARAMIVSTDPKGWTIGPIIQRHGSTLPRVGDQVVITTVSGSTATIFRSEIAKIENAYLRLLPPTKVYSRDRRKHHRLIPNVAIPAMLDGCKVQVADLSTHGARLVGPSNARSGDRLMLALPSGLTQCWVLSTEDQGDNREVRVVFENPLSSLPKKLNCPTLG